MKPRNAAHTDIFQILTLYESRQSGAFHTFAASCWMMAMESQAHVQSPEETCRNPLVLQKMAHYGTMVWTGHHHLVFIWYHLVHPESPTGWPCEASSTATFEVFAAIWSAGPVPVLLLAGAMARAGAESFIVLTWRIFGHQWAEDIDIL